MNILWLTKVSLVESSAKECARWDFHLMPLKGNTPDKILMLQMMGSLKAMPLHVATNYEALNSPEFREELERHHWDFLVVDEVHRLRGGANATPTKLYQNLDKFLMQQSRRDEPIFPLFLSGSIINNKTEELYAYLHLFNRELFPSLNNFKRVFCDSYNYVDTNKLLRAVAPNTIRRTKKEVGIQLPGKFYKVHKLEWDKTSEIYKIYTKLVNQAIFELESMGENKLISQTSMLALLTYSRALLLAPGTLKVNTYPPDPITGEKPQIPVVEHIKFKTPYIKLDYAFELACEIMDEGEQVVIFSAQFNTPLAYMKDLFETIGKRVGVIQGGSDTSKLEEDFQQGKIDVLLCNLKSAAEGLNLHCGPGWPGGASQAIFLDRWYNPELNRQGEDRLHRTGTMYPVTIHQLMVDGSVDQLIEDIIQDKLANSSLITEHKALRAGDWAEKLRKLL